MKKLVFSIMVASASFSAVPAAAQVWKLQPRVQQEIRSDINQLEKQIKQAQQRRTISAREATTLNREAANLRKLFTRYNGNGLTRAEVIALEKRVNNLRQRLRLEGRDWN